MAAFESTPFVRSPGLDAATALVRRPGDLDVPILVAVCWAILVVAELTGASAALHHHALIEGGVPLTAAIPMFLVGWLVMAAAMMLPASLRAIQLVEGAASSVVSPRRARSTFLASFALVWTAFGLVGIPGRRRPPPCRRHDAVARGAAVAHRGGDPGARGRLPARPAQAAQPRCMPSPG